MSCSGLLINILLNYFSTGFYRVNYDEENWLSLIEQLKKSPATIPALNRAQLIDDSLNLARAGKLNYSVALSLTDYLEKENDVIPWFAAMNGLNYVLDHTRRGNLKAHDDIKVAIIV